MDITNLSLCELMALNKQVKDAIATRKPNELKKAKKVWLSSDVAATFHKRVEELRKEYTKLASKLNKKKSIVLRVQLDVDVAPIRFEEAINGRWERDFNDVFSLSCKGKLLNPGDCNKIAKEVQENIDMLMDEMCSDVAEIHGPLYDECGAFVDKLNSLINDLGDSQQLEITPADLIPKKGKK